MSSYSPAKSTVRTVCTGALGTSACFHSGGSSEKRQASSSRQPSTRGIVKPATVTRTHWSSGGTRSTRKAWSTSFTMSIISRYQRCTLACIPARTGHGERDRRMGAMQTLGAAMLLLPESAIVCLCVRFGAAGMGARAG